MKNFFDSVVATLNYSKYRRPDTAENARKLTIHIIGQTPFKIARAAISSLPWSRLQRASWWRTSIPASRFSHILIAGSRPPRERAPLLSYLQRVEQSSLAALDRRAKPMHVRPRRGLRRPCHPARR